KSLGNVVDPFALAERYGVDAVRYYLLREFPYGQDGVVSEAGLRERSDADLANTLGNLVNRLRVMLLRYRDGVIPSALPDAALLAEGDGLAPAIDSLIAELRIHHALDRIMRFVQTLNRYVDDRRPWELARDPARSNDLDIVLASLVAGLNVVSILLAPAMPGKMAELRASLGLTAAASLDDDDVMAPGTRIPVEAEILFPKQV
ncbi:MAG TPA: class I tRNA ligase family protein, partial [Nitrolancea sp.]